MKKIIPLFYFILISTLSFSQENIIKKVTIGDTLNIKVEKIACRYGFDSRFNFSLTKTEDHVMISTDSMKNWTILSAELFKQIIRIEREAIKKGSLSTNITSIVVYCKDSFQSYNTSWKNADKLKEIIDFE